LKKSVTKLRSGRVAQGVSPKFKPQYHKKKEREKERKQFEHWFQIKGY
jgi:hypothetical protein